MYKEAHLRYGHPYGVNSFQPRWYNPSHAAFQYHTLFAVSIAGLLAIYLPFQRQLTVLPTRLESWQWQLPYGRHWSQSVSQGKSPNDPLLPTPDLSKPQLHEYGQFRLQKILLERHAHHEKLGKSPPHPRAHEIFRVGNQYRFAQTEYRPSHSRVYHGKFQDLDAD